jgi:hypothetical protein
MRAPESAWLEHDNHLICRIGRKKLLMMTFSDCSKGYLFYDGFPTELLVFEDILYSF